MQNYFTKHKWHLVIFVILIIVAGVSGYYSFNNTTQDSHNTTQNTLTPKITDQNQINNKIHAEQPNNETIEQLNNSTSTTSPSNTTPVAESSTFTTGQASSTPTTPMRIGTSTEVSATTTIETLTTLKINDEEYRTELKDGMTVYEMMQILTTMSIKPFSFTTKEFTGMGHFVESINGIENDNKAGKYWIYYINGQSAQMGISIYKLNSNDVIEWKYETTNF